MHFKGIVYRAYGPKWAAFPVSGEGAMLHGGRFNAKGTPALYTSLEYDTAIREFAQGMFPLKPFTMASIDVDCADICDLRDPSIRSAEGVSMDDLRCDWDFHYDKLLAAIARGDTALPPVPSWDIAKKLIARGYAGMLTDSFVDYPRNKGVNLVLWEWQSFPHEAVEIDPDGELPRDQRSWAPP